MALHHDGRFDGLEAYDYYSEVITTESIRRGMRWRKTTGKEPVEDVLRSKTGKSGEFPARHR